MVPRGRMPKGANRWIVTPECIRGEHAPECEGVNWWGDGYNWWCCCWCHPRPRPMPIGEPERRALTFWDDNQATKPEGKK